MYAFWYFWKAGRGILPAKNSFSINLALASGGSGISRPSQKNEPETTKSLTLLMWTLRQKAGSAGTRLAAVMESLPKLAVNHVRYEGKRGVSAAQQWRANRKTAVNRERSRLRMASCK
uniref:Uncharacterized protein n=1 Tax=Timema douglasi TaxID=61478 RepID=A0A7R8ZBZ8_TIMDO|nr:unnamed protein product [Timema douglasi]